MTAHDKVCSEIYQFKFWLGHVSDHSGNSTGQPQKSPEMSDCLFMLCICMYTCMYIFTFINRFWLRMKWLDHHSVFHLLMFPGYMSGTYVLCTCIDLLVRNSMFCSSCMYLCTVVYVN